MSTEEFEKMKAKQKQKSRIFREEMDDLTEELKTILNEPRASAILIEGYISFACDQILAYRFDADVFEHLDLHAKRKLLEKLGIIDKDLSNDIEKIQMIRNIYAHRRHIKEEKTLKELKEKIESTHTYKLLNPNCWGTDIFELFLVVSRNILSQLNYEHTNLMIDEAKRKSFWFDSPE